MLMHYAHTNRSTTTSLHVDDELSEGVQDALGENAANPTRKITIDDDLPKNDGEIPTYC